MEQISSFVSAPIPEKLFHKVFLLFGQFALFRYGKLQPVSSSQVRQVQRVFEK